MTNHQKRLSVPKSWPVERKTETFTVKAGAGPHGEAGVPLLILLRDVLDAVDTRKEARYALATDSVLVNGDPINDEDRPIGMFDILALPALEEYYRVFPDEGGRLSLTPIDADAAGSRLGKVVGKRQVTGGETQLSLHDGTNVTVDDGDEYGPNDSIVVDNESKEIVAHFPYDEGALVTAVQGNHAGKIGQVAAIEVTYGSGSNIVHVEPAAQAATEAAFETVEEYVVVIDENFIDDEPDESADDDTTESPEAVEESPDDDGASADEDVDESDDAESVDDSDDVDEESADHADDESESDTDDESASDTDDESADDTEDGDDE